MIRFGTISLYFNYKIGEIKNTFAQIFFIFTFVSAVEKLDYNFFDKLIGTHLVSDICTCQFEYLQKLAHV